MKKRQGFVSNSSSTSFCAYAINRRPDDPIFEGKLLPSCDETVEHMREDLINDASSRAERLGYEKMSDDEIKSEYIEKNKDSMKEKIRGLYIVCGNMRNPVGQKQKEQFIDNHLAVLCGVSNVPSKPFNGRMTSKLLSQPVLGQMEMMGMSLDWDDLKRSDCMQFGETILNSME